MPLTDLDILSARIYALSIVQAQALALMAHQSGDPLGFIKGLGEGGDDMLAEMPETLRMETAQRLEWIYQQALRGATQ